MGGGKGFFMQRICQNKELLLSMVIKHACQNFYFQGPDRRHCIRRIFGIALFALSFFAYSAVVEELSGQQNVLSKRNGRNISIQSTPIKPEHVIIEQRRILAKGKKGALARNHFTGKLLSLNFQKIEIKAVLQLIANFTGINIVVSEKVRGEIALKLDKIPWDQALDIILNMNHLHQHKEGNVITVMPDLVQEPLSQNKEAEFHEHAPLESVFIRLQYAKVRDVALLLNENNHSLLSDRGQFRADSRTNTLWVSDKAQKIAEVQQFIQRLDVPVRQVLIEARIVHLARESIQDLGIRFDALMPKEARIAPKKFSIDLGAVTTNPATVGIALAKLGNGILLDLELSALESEDKAEIIASPRLMTMDQQTAVIESGEEIPYQESTSSGATNVTFKKAVLSLKVTPQITANDRLLLALHINQDTPSGKLVNNVPTIYTREIQTNVLVNNGQTLVLGGIYKQEQGDTAYGLPGLQRLPSWANLFRKKHKQRKNEELLIFITPKIVANN